MTQDEPRRAILAEVRRAVLIEAGHRCAIQTCRSAADVDIHHIVPWAESHSHAPENLVALCPNCHRRADRGEIDRRSLRKYKEICQGLQRPLPRHEEPKTFIKFKPRTIEVLEASNITSFVDVGTWRFGFMFGASFGDERYVTVASGSGSVRFRVRHQTAGSVEVELDDTCPDIVRMEFSQ